MAHRLAWSLVAAGQDVVKVVTPWDSPAQCERSLEVLEGELEPRPDLSGGRSNFFATNLAVLEALISVAMKTRILVLNVFDFRLGPAVLALSRSIPGAVVVPLFGGTLVGRYGDRRKELAYFASIEAALARQAKAIAVPHESGASELVENLGIEEAKIHVVGCGIDLPPAQPNRRTKDVLFVGRLAPEKGLEILIKAFSLIAAEHEDSSLVIAGDGPLKASLLGAVRERPWISQRVRFLGQRAPADVQTLIATAGVTVVPSYYDPYPAVVLEALAAGCPVVVSDVGALPEMVANGDFGGVFAPGNESHLARLLDEVLSASRYWQAKAERGSNYVRQHHSWERFTARMQQVFNTATSDLV